MHADEKAVEVFAHAILREIPLAQVGSYLAHLKGQNAIGDACGNGCGSGCGNNCARPVDPFGYTELSVAQLNAIAANKAGLQKAIAASVHQYLQHL